MSAVEVLIARHGETDWNRQRRFQGQTDISLNALGRAQAKRLGDRLAGEAITAVYASDLSRASQTAHESAIRHGLPVVQDARLRERHFGVFEGNTYDDIELRFPEDYRRWQEREADFTIGHGESLRQVSARMTATLEELATRHRGERILVVTHGSALDLVYRMVNGLTLEQPRAWATPNAALNHLRFEAGRWQVGKWADQAHLLGLDAELVSQAP
jgi:probable phosphoglycerate mutase